MRKIWSLIAVALLTAFGTTACAQQKEASNTLTVAASAVPHAEILEHVKPILEKEGVHLQIRVFQDYVLPNKVVEEGQADANYFQHVPWMENVNKEQGYHIVKVVAVHIEPMGAYSHKVKNVKQLKDGATVALPNDVSNETRALLLLEKGGLIKLDNHNGPKTEKNIVSNPKHLQLKPLEAAMLPRVLDQVDLDVINTNYAMQAHLNPLKDALILEDKRSIYANVLATKKGKEKDPRIQKLAKALTSPEVKKFIEQKYKGAIIPAF